MGEWLIKLIHLISLTSNSFTGKLELWDLEDAPDPQLPSEGTCINTFVGQAGQITALQLHDVSILGSSISGT